MQPPSTDRPTVIFLHFLGGSARSWVPLRNRLDGAVRSIALDLPGFGDASNAPGDSVAHMADAVVAAIRAEPLSGWALAGHSMGAKIATVVARRAQDGESGLDGLSHLILLAGSPPSPEPMDEAKREEMLGWFAADPAEHRVQAQGYIAANTADPFTPEQNDAAIDDVLRADPARWRAWLDRGSREDWASRVGTLHTPALIVTGADDPFLGPDGQARLTLPHFANARHVDLGGAKHLLPLERPGEVAELMLEHLR